MSQTVTEMADEDIHDYINFEYYLQNIGKSVLNAFREILRAPVLERHYHYTRDHVT